MSFMDNQHYCLDDSYPGGRIVCLCVRGVDHTQDEFDVPLEDADG